MAKGGIRNGGPGRPKGVPNRATMIGREHLERLVNLMETAGGPGTEPERLLRALRRTLKEKPEQYLSVYLAALRHLAPPARAPEPGTEDKPLVIEVRERSTGSHQSEAASAAAAVRRHASDDADE